MKVCLSSLRVKMLLVSLFCVQMGFAQFTGGGGAGTETDPYQLSTLAHLEDLSKAVANNTYPVNAYWQLQNDIDATDTKTAGEISNNGGKGFTPIGSATAQFKGHLKGRGFVVKNLYINRPNERDIGFVGYLGAGSSIDSLGVVGGSIKGGDAVGGLVGNSAGNISYSYATGDISAASNYSGGLVGISRGDISYSYATGRSSADSYSGGLVGHSSGDISYSYATGYSASTTSSDSYSGGLAGYSSGNISYSYATGASSSRSYSGGLVGYWSESSNIANSYATGRSSAIFGFSGGLVGYWSGSGTITNSYATGAVSAPYSGGLVGSTEYSSGSVIDSYWDTETTGKTSSAGVEGKSTAEMRLATTYSTWDFDAVWAIDPITHKGYPNLQWTEKYTAIFDAGTGSITPSATQIVVAQTILMPVTAKATAEGEIFTNWTVNDIEVGNLKTLDGYKPTSDITIKANFEKAFGGGMGTSQDPFKLSTLAHLEALSRTVSARSAKKYIGIYFSLTQNIDASATGDASYNAGKGFAPIGTATYPFNGNLNGEGFAVENLTINRPDEDNIGFIGYAGTESTIASLGVISCSITGALNVGGLVGTSVVNISHCYASGAVSGTTSVGGLVGTSTEIISRSYSLCSVEGTNSVGGLLGAGGGSVFNSYARGSVQGASHIGGVIGLNGVVTNSYATGAVSSTNASVSVGGLVGTGGTITNSYWDKSTTGQTKSSSSLESNVASEGGKTTTVMQTVATYLNWNFENTWAIDPLFNDGYPSFQWQKEYTVSFIAGSSGSISPADNQSVTYGESVTGVTATANSGYTFVNWTVTAGEENIRKRRTYVGSIGRLYPHG